MTNTARGALFPFDNAYLPTTKQAIVRQLPSKGEASNLVESYYRYYAWQ